MLLLKFNRKLGRDRMGFAVIVVFELAVDIFQGQVGVVEESPVDHRAVLGRSSQAKALAIKFRCFWSVLNTVAELLM